MNPPFDAIVAAPFGSVGIRVRDDFLLALDLLHTPVEQRLPEEPFIRHVAACLLRYFDDSRSALDLPVALEGTPFQKRVWRAIAAIPPGQTKTYSALAQRVGSGPRAVANACGANRLPLLIPCHRVVAKNGIGGFMQGAENGLAIKAWLLRHESGQ
jgi:methylated-DNA-[protein]-cysteine S-methyltransferase